MRHEDTTFICNICARNNPIPPKGLDRETASCEWCGSTPRWRSIVNVLSVQLFGDGLALADFPSSPQVRGVGLSDWPGYADLLSKKFSYLNTFYDREPRLDLTQPLPADFRGEFDFVLASDVFEHVAPPVEVGLRNCRGLLKPGGLLVLTVPYCLDPDTKEHFPNLHQYEFFDFQSEKILVNRTNSGRLEVFDQLSFHGQCGLTLEMRVFSKEGLEKSLRAAGFVAVQFPPGDMKFGATWPEPFSHPLIARSPKEPASYSSGTQQLRSD